MYTVGLKPALVEKWPVKKSFYTFLEDNAPTGFKSTKGLEAKKTAKLKVFEIPKRSRDLSPLDYAVGSEINKRMRKHERNWAKSKRETRAQYLTRLNRTAKRLPGTFINKTVDDMRRRCQRLYDAHGGSFEEGSM